MSAAAASDTSSNVDTLASIAAIAAADNPAFDEDQDGDGIRGAMPGLSPESPSTPCANSEESSGAGRTGRFSAEERRILVSLIWNDSHVLSAFCHQQRKQSIRGKSFMHLITDRFNEKTNQKRSHDAVRHHLKLRRSNLGPLVDKSPQVTPAERDIRMLDKLLEHRWVCSSHNACTRCLQMHRLRVQRGLAKCDYASCSTCDQRLPSVKAPFDARSLLLEVRRRFYSKVAPGRGGHHHGSQVYHGHHPPGSPSHAGSPYAHSGGLSSPLYNGGGGGGGGSHLNDSGMYGNGGGNENDRVGALVYAQASGNNPGGTSSPFHLSSMLHNDHHTGVEADFDRSTEIYHGEERPLNFRMHHAPPPPPPISTSHNVLHLSQIYPDPLDLFAVGRTTSSSSVPNNHCNSSLSNGTTPHASAPGMSYFDFDFPPTAADHKADDAIAHAAFQRNSSNGTSRALAQLLKLTPRNDDAADDNTFAGRHAGHDHHYNHHHGHHQQSPPKSPPYMRLQLQNLNARRRPYAGSSTSTPSSRSSSPVSPNSRAQTSASPSPMLSPTRHLPGALAPLSLNGPSRSPQQHRDETNPASASSAAGAASSPFALSHHTDSPPSPMVHFSSDDFFGSSQQSSSPSPRHPASMEHHKRKTVDDSFNPASDFDSAADEAFATPQSKSPRLA